VSSRRAIHLAAPDPLPERLRSELAACGIFVGGQDAADAREYQGVVLTGPADREKGTGMAWTKPHVPRLLLLYGYDIPHGWADAQAAAFPGAWEVVRMMLLAGGERALIGGEPGSFYVELLRRHLADYSIASLVCARREVDEVCRQLPRYLTLKEAFFVELGDLCDELGISLQVVSRAMGLDKRIGQEWLYPERTDQAHICRWIARETRPLLEKPNVQRVTLWGSPSFWQQMPEGWLKDKEVRLYAKRDGRFPNEVPGLNMSGCTVFSDWAEALQGADLLVIGEADEVIRQLDLNRLSQSMEHSIVVDATACFPLQEAKMYLKIYRSFGEKTNIWE
jgi:hypothetical protein